MEIQQIGAIQSTLAGVAKTGGTGTDVGQAFAELLNSLSQTEGNTGALVQRAAAGEDVDIHDVMIATQAESLAFQVGLQVRNKLVEAYHEIFRMQM